MIRYFDNCATTKVDADVLRIINEYSAENYYNPSARSSFSLNVSNDISRSRAEIAKILGVTAKELYFTSGGTESDNLAIFGAVKSKRSGNIVVTASEHSAVYNSVTEAASCGLEVRYANVLPDGRIDVEDFVSRVDSDTVLACFMHVNNETGAINDVRRINALVKAENPRTVTFSDGVQAVGKIPVNLRNLGVDAYSFSGHKIHCTKGIGCLYVKDGVRIRPLAYGGGQEKGLRSGTEFVAGMVSLSQALKLSVDAMDVNSSHFCEYKKIIRSRLEKITDCKELCVDFSSPAIMTLAFASVKGEVLQHMLEKYDIIVGTGSACSSKNKQSRIAKAVGLDGNYSEGIIRISFSKYNTVEDAEFLGEKLALCVSELRKTMLTSNKK